MAPSMTLRGEFASNHASRVCKVCGKNSLNPSTSACSSGQTGLPSTNRCNSSWAVATSPSRSTRSTSSMPGALWGFGLISDSARGTCCVRLARCSANALRASSTAARATSNWPCSARSWQRLSSVSELPRSWPFKKPDAPTSLHVSPDLGNAAVEIISPRLSHALEFHTPALCGLEVRVLLHDEFGTEKVTAFQACPESIFQSSGESRPLRNGRHHLRKLRPEFPSFVQVQARNEQYRTCERFGRSGLCGEQLGRRVEQIAHCLELRRHHGSRRRDEAPLVGISVGQFDVNA